MKKIINFIPAICLTITFIVWTILVKTVDVKYIDDVGYLGFYHFNIQVNQNVIEFARANLFDKLTDIGLYLSFASVLGFAILGVVQLVKRKSLKKVDIILYLLLAVYVISVMYYLIFEINKINYSPLSTPEELKASYPSSHVLFFITFMFIGLIAFFDYVRVNKVIKICSYAFLGMLSVVYATSRLYSLHHYFSDIMGAVLLSGSLVLLFVALKKQFVKPQVEEK